MAWWMWVLFGIALLFVEIVTPGGLFALFFGVGALCVAVLAALGAASIAQWLAFTAISLLLLVTLRRTLQQRLLHSGAAPVDSLVGAEVVLLADLSPGEEGKAELRGVPWQARGPAGEALKAGQRCRVERVDGLTLWVRAV
jgi:membrane protein implicated in regulation of membrane protease activity